MDKDKTIVTTCLFVAALIYFCANERSLIGERDERSLILAISSEHRPRVVYFYGKWCPACKHYTPIVKKAAAVYAKYIDYQEVDVDDPTTRLPKQFNIRSIPTTIIFDSYGHVAFGESGIIDEISLNDILMSVYRSSANRSARPSKSKSAAKRHRH